MPTLRIDIRPTGRKLTNMEHTILGAAKLKAQGGADQNYIRLFIEEEIKSWKKRDKYRTAHTTLLYRSQWEMALMNGSTELAIFKTVI